MQLSAGVRITQWPQDLRSGQDMVVSRTAIKGGNFVFTRGQQEQSQTMVGNRWFGAWNISNVTTMGLMFNGVTLSAANYDALLIGWANPDPGVQARISFDAGNSRYSAGAASTAPF